MKSLRIIFMGTPEFAVPSLELLIKNDFNVVAVVTAPDKPKGRGQKIEFSPVKAVALRHDIPTLQPTNLKSPDFIETLRSYKANLQVVVAFRMLPEIIWSMPELGTFNLHASLLPQYRGAAPIHWAIINGETETGVTTFMLQHEIDTGNIIFQEREPIYPSDTVGDLYQRLMEKGATLVLRTTMAIASGNIELKPQVVDAPLKHAPKIFRESCEVKWNASTFSIVNLVRGLTPMPGSWTILGGKPYKLLSVAPTSRIEKALPGEIISDGKNFIHVKTADGWISIDEFQPEGKRRMTPAEFFRGNAL